MGITTASVLGDIEKYRFNPVMLQRVSLSTLRSITNGEIDIVDGTNPFVALLEATSLNTAAFMQQCEALTRKQYPVSANTIEDLYLHMSDKDYINRFALPTTAQIHLILNKAEVLNALILDNITGIKSMIIPRNSTIKVADITFSLQYPIEIRQLPHGGIQASYIVDKFSPLKTLLTNIVDFIVFQDSNNNTYLNFALDMDQFFITSATTDVNASSGIRTDITLTDSFYYARAYVQDTNGIWNEINTTYTEQIYDPLVPTVVIKVLDTSVVAIIPVIYTTSNLIRGKVRFDIYQTKGQQNLLLSNYTFADYTAKWYSVDKNDDTPLTVPIKTLKTVMIYSTTNVSGGRAELTVDELRNRVIDNTTGGQILPITQAKLQAVLTDNGYEVAKNIDTVTDRVFLATKAMPKPLDTRILTAASSSMTTVLLSMKEASNSFGVIDNGDSVTLTSKSIYQNINGVTRLISNSEYTALNLLAPVKRAAAITSNGYSFSPFYYVLDASKEIFSLRPYHLDSPKIVSKNFVSTNSSLGYQVSSDTGYSISKTDTGYLLKVITKSSDNFKQLDDSRIFAQLSFIPKGESTRAYLLGTLTGKNTDNERVYEFIIDSTHYLDTDDYLYLSSFLLYPSSLPVGASLIQAIDITFSVKNTENLVWGTSAVDDVLGRFQLPSDAVGLTQEKLSVQFGNSLTTLWSQSRSVVSSVPYKKYTVDIPRLYTEDVYDKDPVTGAIFTIVDGDFVYNAKKDRGTPVLDSSGLPVYSHRVGDPILDISGNPVPLDNYQREMIRYVDLFTLDGLYYFATNQVVKDYTTYAINSIVQWLINDLTAITPSLLELTRIFFYPKVTQGNIKVFTYNGIEQVIPAGQSLVVTLYVDDIVYQNVELISALKITTIQNIDAWLNNATVTISALIAQLRSVYNSDVISVAVSGLGGTYNYDTVSVVDTSNRLSIKKKLSILGDGQTTVEEDITINFILHKTPIV